MTQHTFFNGKRSDEWSTPPEIWSLLHEQYDFVWDLAASDKNKKRFDHFSKDNSALTQDWPLGVTCWLNPPFSMANKFFEKCVEQAARGVRIVAIYKAANPETETWQRWIFPWSNWITFMTPRINYVNEKGEQSVGVTFGSALIGFNVEAPTHYFGWTVRSKC